MRARSQDPDEADAKVLRQVEVNYKSEGPPLVDTP